MLSFANTAVNFQDTVTESFYAALGYDVASIATSETGNILLLLASASEWQTEDSEPTLVNVIEFDPINQVAVAGYPAYTDTEGDLVKGEEIAWDASTGQYFIYSAGLNQVFAYDFLPDTTRTEVVEKTRMVQVEVMPEPVVVDETPVTEDAVEAAEAVDMDVDLASEPSKTLEEDEVADETEAVDEEVFDADTPAVTEEEALIEEGETLAVEDQVIQQVESELTEQDATVEDAEIAEQEVVEEAAGTDQSEEQVSDSEEDIAPVVPEEAKPVLKWVEETYEETVEVVVSNRFGAPITVFSMDDLEISLLWGLNYDNRTGSLFGFSNLEESTALHYLSLSPNASISKETVELVELSGRPITVFEDSVTGHWVIVTDEGWTIVSREGRKLREISNSVDSVYSSIFELTTETETLLIGQSESRLTSIQWDRPHESFVHHVPGEFPTIQAAVDAAASGHTILLSPGLYESPVVVSDKSVRISSYYDAGGEPYFIENTVLSTSGQTAITVYSSVPSPVEVSGISVRNSEVGIASSGQLNASKIELTGNGVGAAIAGGTAIFNECVINANEREGLRYDDATATLVEYCTINENGSDGIYIAITPYDGVLYRTVLRRNQINDNGGAGIHFEDQPITTKREFRIENNFLLRNMKSGIEVFLEQADPKNPIPTGPRTDSAVYLVNNTIVGSPIGILRGGNYRVVNNIITQCSQAGIQDVTYHSVVIRNLLWENEENSVDSNFNASNNLEENPIFVGDDYVLSVRSPAKRAGIPGNLWNDTSDRSGADIGASR
jgi:hypothetical protein